MEALMSHFLSSAKMRTTPQDKAPTPLDLALCSFTKHTCDRLIAPEDLRPEQDSFFTADDESPVTRKHWEVSLSTPKRLTIPDSTSSSSIHEQEHSERRDVHPFSIVALLKDSGVGCSSDNEPAQVYSPYMDITRYQLAPLGICRQTCPVSDRNTPDTSLSPIRAEPMSNTNFTYWCHVCNAFCQDKNEPDRHKFAHRIQGDTCTLRRAVAKDHGYVTRHEMLDSDRLNCGLCLKVVSTCFFLKHQRLHNGHVCSICDKEFATNNRLRDHVNVHTGNTSFSCSICDRKFCKRSSLTQHQRYHRDHKSFMCRFCPKCFNSKYACAVHERLHTGDNPFKCQMPGCTRAFPQKIQLKLHINSHHRG